MNYLSRFNNLSGSTLNTYQNNNCLPDEIRFALDRKRFQRHIGNTLEKPHLLLKNTFIRDTTFNVEQLHDEEGTIPRKTQKLD